jgi:hypothetical protein
MSIYIPCHIANIILEYYAQMKQLKWIPFIDAKTGKLIWKVNKYSIKYANINNMIAFRKYNSPHDINININITRENDEIDSFNIIGKCICVNKKYCMNKSTSALSVIREIYIEYIDQDNFNHALFCSVLRKKARMRRYDVYQDGVIYSLLVSLTLFNGIEYSIVLDKY